MQSYAGFAVQSQKGERTMRVIRADFMGLCFGVRDALEIAATTTDPQTVTIYGELVHNPMVQNQLLDQGYQVLREAERDSSHHRDRIMITAHGISQKRLSELRSKAIEIIDTTCPLVRRVHEAAMKLEEEGRFVVIVGRSNHVEVQGVTEDLNRWLVIESESDVAAWHEPRLGVICQSTTMPEAASRCLAEIMRTNSESDVRYIDTICRPTRQRQEALDTLCQQVAIVVVVGGHRSNNTQQLAERCRSMGRVVHQIENASWPRCGWLNGWHKHARRGYRRG
jgi:4-hydroxy-3-methylbut-2-en-1-yl diphosphate reductase